MSKSFRAWRVHEEDGHRVARLEAIKLEDLSSGDLVIRARYSSVNYKDALAGTGRGKIMRRFPLVAGIDVAGEVVSCEGDAFQAGEPVLVTGCGLGESHDGGYADFVRVPAQWAIPLPEGLSLRQAMIIGTAGFSAALALHRLEQNGQCPDQGPVLVTGATGGVGSFAVGLLRSQGYEVYALTGKPEHREYLKGLGAAEVLDRMALHLGEKPLEKALWGGAIDNLGGEYLAWLNRTTKTCGSIAAIGMAAGIEVNTTVMPFILRGVSVLGINSATCPMKTRLAIWEKLGGTWRPQQLDQLVSDEVGLQDLPRVWQELIAGQHHGRTLVRL